jgi:hypothetical protein
MTNMNSMRDVLSCLFTLGPFVTVAGVLFVYNCREERLTTEEATILRWLRCFCGPKFYQNITIVVTKWDGLSTREVRRARQRFQDHTVDTTITHGDMAQILNPPQQFAGGKVYYHGIPLDEEGNWHEALDYEDEVPERGALAKAMIQDRYRNAPKADLQVMQEQKHGVAIENTEAAKVLRSELSTTKVCISDRRALLLHIDDPAPEELADDIFEKFFNSPSPGSRYGIGSPSTTSSPFDWIGSYGTLSWVDWINIGKNVALFFWTMGREWQKLNKPKPGVLDDLWSRVQGLKNWWAGEKPPQT